MTGVPQLAHREWVSVLPLAATYCQVSSAPLSAIASVGKIAFAVADPAAIFWH